MTQPHHHVFNVLQGAIISGVPIDPLIEYLRQNNVFKKREDEGLFRGKNGMKILTGYLRSKDYDTFVGFVSAMSQAYLLSDAGKTIDISIVKSMQQILSDFDERNNTSHVTKIDEIVRNLEQAKSPTVTKSTEDDDTRVVEETRGLEEPSVSESDQNAPDDDNQEKTEHHLVGSGLPDLPYLHDEPYIATFTHANGGHWTNERYSIELSAGPGVVPDGKLVLLIGVCAWGNFSIPRDKYQVITGFLCVSANQKLAGPIKVAMQHCLSMPKYQTLESVVILRADHNTQYGGSYAFSPTKLGESVYSIHPCILEDEPTLWFHVENEFCILCVAYKKDQITTTTTNTTTNTNTNIPSSPQLRDTLAVPQQSQPLPPSPPSSPSHGAMAAQPDEPKSPTHQNSLLVAPRDTEKDSIRHRQKRKLSPASRWEDKQITVAKKTCQLELVIMMVEPKNKTAYFMASIYVFQNCSTSLEECLKQAKKKYEHIDSYSFQGNVTETDILFSCRNRCSDWSVAPKKTPSVVTESELYITQGSYAKTLAEEGMYPPRIDFQILSSSTHSGPLMCDIVIQGFYANDYNTQVPYFTLTAPPLHQQSGYTCTPPSTNYIASLTETQRDTAVNEDAILKMAYHISNWRAVGQFLGITESSLQSIQDYDPFPGESEWPYQVLLKWHNENEPAKRTYGVLVTALQKSNEIQAIEELIKLLRS